MKREPTRGGLKLEAAMKKFALAAHVRGKTAIDVGSSTGGFVTVLLEQGATRVTAVDVGHGQLLQSLRDDVRVVNAERTDFKTLSLNEHEGPFDFFSVDVSFVAGRSMLRPLAFRLRDGAQGVVLLKPQFELPSHLVKKGDVSDPALRRRAFDLFAAKAKKLGFSIQGQLDSPVEGGSGTVEILLHLRFNGRPDVLPKEGERKPTKPVKKKIPALPPNLRWFAVAAPGLEEVLGAELGKLPGLADIAVIPGGVEFSGPMAAGMIVNLRSRIATRVLLRLGTVKARDFAPLRRGLAKFPFASVIPTDRPMRVDASTTRCRLYHTGALGETLALAIKDAVGDLPARADDPNDDGPLTRLLLRGDEDRFTLSVDSSGDLLHKRGYRTEAGPAPLRETLAAAILALCDYDPALPLVDPMCGSGTFSIEAAAIAANLPAGRQRTFGFCAWPCHDASQWTAMLGKAGAAVSTPTGPILASDRDTRVVETAKRNAERAGLPDRVDFRCASLGDAKPPAGPGLVIINPPYGHRLGDRRELSRQFRSLGQALRANYPGYRVAILCPSHPALDAIAGGYRAKPGKTISLRNGGLKILLAIWDAHP